ncbi:hypothetical protein EXU85_13145 [Spirosoma sp. KCTC 42546]|uniref:DUF6932 family protein n=1 Tax=Spirosoma sp. KCTC 42546 TaxID=2520506 RepID=UPI00115AAE4C|nr:hypothetical protein [Spirosoma sp. KCTC 42546]QDK79497.1 hypothetical protein EXU85_13145 [Spirosoma sp. KCTC 42546]
MQTLHFDAQGHLVPYDLIATDWESFVETFGWNDHRLELIELLHSLLNDINKLSIRSLTLWIDGSFVTKKEKPNDLDVVFVLPKIIHHQFEKDLRLLKNQFARLDVYFVRMIDERERDHFLYVSDRAEWLFQFTMTKPDRVTRRKFPKGFIQITWNNESTLKLT